MVNTSCKLLEELVKFSCIPGIPVAITPRAMIELHMPSTIKTFSDPLAIHIHSRLALPLLLLLFLLIATLLGSLGLLSPDTAGAASTEGRGQGEVNVLLGVQTDDERGDVDNLLADADVTLADEDTSVVDGLGKTELVDASLEAALQEILNLQGQDVIELHAGLVEDTDTDETANQGISFEKSLGVLLIESEQLTIVDDGLVHVPFLKRNENFLKTMVG